MFYTQRDNFYIRYFCLLFSQTMSVSLTIHVVMYYSFLFFKIYIVVSKVNNKTQTLVFGIRLTVFTLSTKICET